MWPTTMPTCRYVYLVPLHLQPEEHVVFQESSLQIDEVLELHTGDWVEQDLSEEQALLGGTVSLKGNSTEKCFYGEV